MNEQQKRTKILLVRRGALGDVVHVAACLSAVKTQRPDVDIHILTSKSCIPILENMPDLAQIVIWPKNHGPFGMGAVFDAVRSIRAEKYDLIVNLMPSVKTRLICLLALVKTATMRKQRLRASGKATRTGVWRHESEKYFEAIRNGLCLAPVSIDKLVPVSKFNNPAEVLKRKRIGFVLGVAGRRANRAWPIDRFLELRDLVAESCEYEIVLIGGKAELPLAERFAGDELVVNRIGCPLSETIQVMRSCSAIVGADTGPTHIATSIPVPVVACFGPTAVDRTGPLGRHTVVTPKEEMACWPCEKKLCPLVGNEHEQCMRSISAELVWAKLQETLATEN